MKINVSIYWMAHDLSEKQNQFYILQTPNPNGKCRYRKGAAKLASERYHLQEPMATCCLQKETKEISP